MKKLVRDIVMGLMILITAITLVLSLTDVFLVLIGHQR